MTTEAAGGAAPQELAEKYGLTEARYTSATGSLYEGKDPGTGGVVIVKVMRERAFATPTDRQRVRRELQKLVQVRHPSLAPILEAGDIDDVTYVVRDFIAGETLGERITSRGRLSAKEAALIGGRVASALAELHRHGVLHRDLRPGHILLGSDGAIYVLDASVGRHFTSSEGRALTGTAGYVAPEAIQGKLVSFRSDLYALGAVLYESLAGVPPYMGLDPQRVLQMQCETDPEPLDSSVPAAMSKLVLNLLQRDARERPFSAQQLERQLEPFASPTSPAAAVPPDYDDSDARTVARPSPSEEAVREALAKPAEPPKPEASTEPAKPAEPPKPPAPGRPRRPRRRPPCDPRRRPHPRVNPRPRSLPKPPRRRPRRPRRPPPPRRPLPRRPSSRRPRRPRRPRNARTRRPRVSRPRARCRRWWRRCRVHRSSPACRRWRRSRRSVRARRPPTPSRWGQARTRRPRRSRRSWASSRRRRPRRRARARARCRCRRPSRRTPSTTRTWATRTSATSRRRAPRAARSVRRSRRSWA
ncbi:MAG: serine/threonine-protein kinase [Polyangiales bacterium]